MPGHCRPPSFESRRCRRLSRPGGCPARAGRAVRGVPGVGPWGQPPAWAWPAAGPGVAGRVKAWGVPADSPVTPVTGARSPAPHANSEPAAGPAPGHRAGVGRVAAGPAPGGAGPLAK